MRELWSPKPGKIYKTHCPNGHEYTVENTILQDRGRFCRECTKIRARRAHRKAYGKDAE